jgi:urease accessory protein
MRLVPHNLWAERWKDVRMASPWVIWQLMDSAFPAGGFAHSNGLESARQAGWIGGGDGLAEFLEVSLRQSARAVAPFVMAAHERPGSFAEVDGDCDAFLTNHVANRASRAQGQSLLAAAARVFPSERLQSLHQLIRRERRPGHSAPVLGAVAAALEIDAGRAVEMALFLVLRNLVSAAVRLGLVGPLEGQSIQARLSPLAIALANPPARDAAQTAPLLDLLQATQDRLYSRLFQS